MEDLQERIQLELDHLNRDFAAELPDKIKGLRTSFQSWVLDGKGASRAAFYQAVHRLAGSAGSLGWPRLGERASDLENLLVQPTFGERLSRDQQSKVASCLQEMAEALHEAPSATAFSWPPPATTLPTVFVLTNGSALSTDLAAEICSNGYLVEIFRASSTLAEALVRRRPDALVLDLAMTAKQPLPPDRDLSVPILFLASDGSLASRLQAVRLGGAAFLTSPAHGRLLVDQLDVLTQRPADEPFRVLVMDDSPLEAARYALLLESPGLSTQVVTAPEKLLDALSDFRPELILLDLYMPGCSGLELASLIRQQETFLSVPILFLSTEAGLSQELMAMQLGGDGFLRKPVSDETLHAAIMSRLRRSRAIRSCMVRDGLTGLLNHTHFMTQLELATAQASRAGGSFACVVLDLDHFKQVNDTYGHTTGDRILTSLSQLLRQRLRNSDVIGRCGGEEFGILLQNPTREGALALMEELRQAFAQSSILVDAAHRCSLTFSAGIAMYQGETHATTLYDAADQALYAAKAAGRNRVILAPVEPRP